MFILDAFLLFFTPIVALLFYLLFIVFKSIATLFLSLRDIIKPVIMIVLAVLIAIGYFFLAGYFLSNLFVLTGKRVAIVIGVSVVSLLLVIGCIGYLLDMIRNGKVTFNSFVLAGIIKVFDGFATLFENIFMALLKTIGEHTGHTELRKKKTK